MPQSLKLALILTVLNRPFLSTCLCVGVMGKYDRFAPHKIFQKPY